MMKMMIMTRENNNNYLIDSDCQNILLIFPCWQSLLFCLLLARVGNLFLIIYLFTAPFVSRSTKCAVSFRRY